MIAKLDYQWRLREVTVSQGMLSTTALRPLRIERGITLSVSQVYRLLTENSERLSLKLLIAPLDILGPPRPGPGTLCCRNARPAAVNARENERHLLTMAKATTRLAQGR